MDTISAITRPASGQPTAALVLLHGRGAGEHDLAPLLDAIDPERRLLGITPRAPLALPPGGRHWYVVREIGFPDPDTFLPAYQAAGEWLDGLEAETGIPLERTVLGGFSQGCVMSWALGLGAGRPRPAGIIALSGFIPSADGFKLDLTGLDGYPVAIGHGSFDPVIGVEWGRQAQERMLAAGADVIYQESPMGHTIDPAFVARLTGWLGDVV
ncbi:MAG: phospholipase/carboxylesterase [Gaiellales bacterium]|nr:phospholipase/carboxylesterase [Gaiellales bacterium]